MKFGGFWSLRPFNAPFGCAQGRQDGQAQDKQKEARFFTFFPCFSAISVVLNYQLTLMEKNYAGSTYVGVSQNNKFMFLLY